MPVAKSPAGWVNSLSPSIGPLSLVMDMQLTLHALTALRITRAIRSGRVAGNLRTRCDLKQPEPSPAKSWTRSWLSTNLERFGRCASFSITHPLEVLVADKNARIRTKGVKCTCRTGTYPAGSFVDLGGGVSMSGPELLFVELTQVMEPAVHLLLGMELCGRFSRNPLDPRNGEVAYDVEPVTTVERLRSCALEAHWIRGARQALLTIDRIVENAWSPMEALIAALVVLPIDELGYDMWPIALNPRKELGERLAQLSDADSRVPDIMFSGTNVGMNYDGEDHFRLSDIARAVVEADREPGDASRSRELRQAMANARAAIVADKRRDRDLMALGLTVFSVTKEDLEETGSFDRLILQVIEAIEGEGSRKLEAQRRMLRNRSRAAARQEFILSLMPGAHSAEARERLEARKDLLARSHECEIRFEQVDGELRIISMVDL